MMVVNLVEKKVMSVAVMRGGCLVDKKEFGMVLG